MQMLYKLMFVFLVLKARKDEVRKRSLQNGGASENDVDAALAQPR